MDPDFQALGRRLVGDWTAEATHPALPGEEITGSSRFEWLEGEQFLVFRSHYDHADIPDAIAILGDVEGWCMHYYDSRGVSRRYALAWSTDDWTILMDRRAPAGSFAVSDAPFAQRIRYSFGPGDETMRGQAGLSHDDEHWEDDLAIDLRRIS